MAFYRDLEQWVGEFRQAEKDGETLFAAVEWILTAPAKNRNSDVYWFMYAAHGLCKDLIPGLTKQQCEDLVQMYDQEFSKKERLAAQDGVYKALSRGARGK